MPIRRRPVRKIGRRRFGAVRRRIGMSGGRLVRRVGLLTGSRRTHYFKRLGNDLVVSNASNTIKFTGFDATSGASGDDFGTNQGGAGLSFRLSQCLEYTDFKALFDRYKIVGVKLKFMFQQSTQ